MLAVILFVLKIIGIIILVILLLAILLLLLVLFVPIRYRIDGTVPKTYLDEGFDTDKIDLKIGFHWLLHILSGKYVFPGDESFTVRVFGIRVYPRKKRSDNKSEERSKKKSKEKSDELESRKDDIIREDMESGLEEKQEVSQTTEITTEETQTTDQDTAFEEETVEDNKKSFADVVEDVISFILKVIKTPQNVFSKIKYTISRVCGKINMIRSTLESEIFSRAFELVKGKLLKILRMICPDKSDIKVLLGVGDPALEAEIMAIYGILYPKLYGKIDFEPDFEQRVVQADVHMKGHITICTVLYCVCVCYFNKDVKRVIGRFKKISAM